SFRVSRPSAYAVVSALTTPSRSASEARRSRGRTRAGRSTAKRYDAAGGGRRRSARPAGGPPQRTLMIRLTTSAVRTELDRWHTAPLSSIRARQSANLTHVTSYVDSLLLQGQLLMLAAEHADLDAQVPTCADWRLRDLLRHVGGVHRWATAHVAGRRTAALPKNEESAV